MINVNFDSAKFAKEMNSIVQYAEGFIDGAKAGKQELIKVIGERTVEILGEFIDSHARVNSEALHHIYEWYQAGSSSSRLFELEYFSYRGGLSIASSFSQSTSVARGSSTPFYDKARIMEMGIPVTIKPVAAKALRFNVDGEEVFSKSPVTIEAPGGSEVQGSFKRVIDSFFDSYFSQSFMEVSGIGKILGNPISFKKNLPKAKSGGRAAGYDVGYRWISAKGAA